jgi:hypothetical protein
MSDDTVKDQGVVSHAPCLKDDPGAPEGGIPCCPGCACTCGSDFPFLCECQIREKTYTRIASNGDDPSRLLMLTLARCPPA